MQEYKNTRTPPNGDLIEVLEAIAQDDWVYECTYTFSESALLLRDY